MIGPDDVLGLLGFVMLLAGVYLGYGLSPALTIGGALLLLIAVAHAVRSEGT